MDLLELLDHLDAEGVELSLVSTPEGVRVRTRGRRLDGNIAAAMTEHRIMVANTLIGRQTGHAPAPCSTCGAVSFVAVRGPNGQRRNTWPQCRMTPGCAGRHEPRPIDGERTRRVSPPAQAALPRKRSKQRTIVVNRDAED
jgi:hypothetical protein